MLKSTPYILLLLSCLLLGQCSTDYIVRQTVKVEDGVLDLRGITLTSNTIIPLTGHWKFYWQELYSGEESNSIQRPSLLAPVPLNWHGIELADGQKFPAIGYATYHLKILMGAKPIADTSILFPIIRHAFKLYRVDNNSGTAKLIASRGKVGRTAEGFAPDTRETIIDLNLSTETDLYLQVSNQMDAFASGLTKSPLFGFSKAIRVYDNSNRQINFFMLGAILIIGFFMITLFLLRRSERSPLWLALFCLDIALRILIINRYSMELLPYPALFPYFFKVNYLTMTLAIASYLAFLIAMFPLEFKNRFYSLTITVSLLYSLIIVLAGSQVFSLFLTPYFLFLIVVFVVVIYSYLSSIFINKNRGILLAFLGTLSTMIFGAADIFSRIWLKEEWNMIQYGLLINLLFMGYIVSLSNATARRKSEELAENLSDEIRQREKVEETLNQVNTNLEHLVKERTRDLEAVYKKLVENAHKAGMAEIASNTLHNVGNVLNSVKTSTDLINGNIIKSPMENYVKAVELLKEKLENFAEFIVSDPRGMSLLSYFIELEKGFATTFSEIRKNLSRLQQKTGMIADIITLQQNMAGNASLVETLDIKEIIEDALEMLPSSFYNHNIKIIKHYQEIPHIPVQRSKLIHILVNLLSNAEQAMQEVGSAERTLTIELGSDAAEVWIKISDTGIGIPPENLKKIFLHGFTTKKTGFGFGLHSCAIYMEEMGGRISVDSQGPEKGTMMSLIFPIGAVLNSASSPQ